MVNVETMTAVASISPMEFRMERPFLRERFLTTRVIDRIRHHRPAMFKFPETNYRL